MPRKKKTIAVIDCETDPFEKGVIPQPFIWGYYDGNNYEEFMETEDLIEFIRGRNEIIYAHNGGKFDFHFLISEAKHDTNIMCVAGRIIKFKIGEAELRDSFAIIPSALKNYSKAEFDYRKLHHTMRHKHMPEIKDYLKSDCENLYNMVSEFRENYGSGVTIAGTAIKYAQKMHKEDLGGTGRAHYENLVKYYAGGRVECFESGIIDGDITLIDINSAYPWAMQHEHPTGDGMVFTRKLPENPQNCFVSLKCISHGALWVREKGRLQFPNDGILREYHVTGWEYETAMKLNLIDNVEITGCYVFNRTVNFKEYVNHFYEIRRQAKERGDKGQDLFAKIFLNSLYGKFAANPDTYEEIQITDWSNVVNKEEEGWTLAGQINEEDFLISQKLPEHKKKWYNIATAASITGFVRAMLLEAAHNVERPLYCDTDSLFYIGESFLENGLELGKWKIEDKFTKIGIGGKKLYAALKDDGKFKIATKGTRLTGEEVLRVCAGEVIEYKPEVPTFSLKGGIYFNSRKVKKTA